MSAVADGARVLIVSALQVYPTLSGGNLRTYALANALAKRGAQVFVYSFVGRKRDYFARVSSGLQTWPSGVQEYVNRSWASFFAGYGSYGLDLPPLWLTTYLRLVSALPRDVLLPRVLREKLAWCDVIIADFPFAYPVFESNSAHGRLAVLNTHNVEHHLYNPEAGWRSGMLRRIVKKLELEAASSADLVVSCSTRDQAFFESSARVHKAVVVPNGVDVERFSMPSEVRRNMREALGVSDSAMLVLFTASRWGPNEEAFEFLRSFVEAHQSELVESEINILVVGGVVDSPLRLPALTATGKVDMVEAYFAAADVGINPIVSGAGTNVKMGEFMAARLPVIVTPFGARGYRIEHSRTGYVCDRDCLMQCLLEVRKSFDENPEQLEAIADAAFIENAMAIDMVECVTPLAHFIDNDRFPNPGCSNERRQSESR